MRNLIIEENEDSLERTLYVFMCDNDNLLDELYFGNEIMEKVREKLSALTDDVLDGLYYDLDEFHEMQAYDLGMEKDMEKGINIRNKEIVKNLLKLNISLEDIKAATGLTEDEINTLNDLQ